MTSVIIIGGRGFVGQKISESLRQDPRFQVKSAGRSPQAANDVYCDLNKPSTFANLQGHDIIINCSDNFVAPPLELVRYCLASGLLLLETTADPQTIDRLIKQSAVEKAKGTVIAGMGIFPGLTNILAGELTRRLQGVEEIQLSIFVSPFSQAGRSTCRLMAEHFCYQTPVIRNGTRVLEPTLQPVPGVPGEGGKGLRLFFPEVVMLAKSQAIPRIETFLVPMPRILVSVLGLLRGLLTLRPLLALNTLSLTLLRNAFLGSRASRIQFYCRARTRQGKQEEAQVATEDGLGSLAAVMHAALVALHKQAPRAGFFMPDEVFTWGDIEAEYRRLRPQDQVRII